MELALPDIEIFLAEAQIAARRFDLEVVVHQHSEARAKRKRPGRGRHFRQVAGQDLAVVGPLELVFGTEFGEGEKRLPVRQTEITADLGREIEDAIIEAVAGRETLTVC